jgi:hypothetical protein
MMGWGSIGGVGGSGKRRANEGEKRKIEFEEED